MFDADTDTVKALVVSAAESPGRFAHVLQRARDDRAEQQRQHAAREEIAAAGVTTGSRDQPWHHHVQCEEAA